MWQAPRVDEYMQLDAASLARVDQPVLVGLSGGRDSVALLRLLLMRGVRVCACHVHHGIRGASADADAAFCRELCMAHAVPYEELHTDVPGLAALRGESLETTARHERRRLLLACARKMSCGAIALAHHADDQAETVLFHLARGSAGLRGMQPVSHEAGMLWVRPLLSCRRAEITAWLTELDQPWRDDPTNAVPDVTRNRLRLEALPALEHAMGRDVVPILNRSARLQGETAEALQTALDALPLTDPQGRLYLPFLSDKPSAFCRAVVHHYLRRCGVPGITARHVAEICAMLEPDAPAAACNLPSHFRARRKEKRLIIERSAEASAD